LGTGADRSSEDLHRVDAHGSHLAILGLHEDMYKLRVQKATNQLENSNVLFQAKKALASYARARGIGA
jgi:hypothetical protein